jgi:predicted nucleic acid-binding protein
MKVAIDTNVILDVLLDRVPHSIGSKAIMWAAERGEISGLLSATTITRIDYFLNKQFGKNESVRAIKDLLSVFEIAPVSRSVLQSALESTMRDFEDAVLTSAAVQSGASLIVTRNAKDFVGAPLPVLTPDEWVVARALRH